MHHKYIKIANFTLTTVSIRRRIRLSFIWIIRKQESISRQVEEWLEAEGLVERVRGKGLIVRGWALLAIILSHPLVGGSLTHCRWNLNLEGTCVGVSMLSWPMFAEQFYNEKMIMDVLEAGVRVGAERLADKQDLVKREREKGGVGKLMEESEDGIEKRKRSEELAKMAKNAFEEGGSSFLNVMSFLRDVMKENSTIVVEC